MLMKLLAVVHLDKPDSLKRALMGFLTFVFMLLVPLLAKVGLSVDVETQRILIEAIAGVGVTLILQSGANALVAKLKTPAEADRVLGVVKPLEPPTSEPK